MERQPAAKNHGDGMALHRPGNYPWLVRLVVMPVLLTLGACGLFEPKELALCSAEIKKRLKSAENYKVLDYESFHGRISVRINISFSTQETNKAPVSGTAICWHSVVKGLRKLQVNGKTYKLN